MRIRQISFLRLRDVRRLKATDYDRTRATATEGTLASKSIVGAQRTARIALEDASVQRVSVEADNVHVLLLERNATRMFVVIAGSVVEMAPRYEIPPHFSFLRVRFMGGIRVVTDGEFKHISKNIDGLEQETAAAAAAYSAQLFGYKLKIS
ncbi:hypothetical protein QQ045_020243 [Rhodiola kirilowii]